MSPMLLIETFIACNYVGRIDTFHCAHSCCCGCCCCRVCSAVQSKDPNPAYDQVSVCGLQIQKHIIFQGCAWVHR
jgi:hypothetical protein